MRLKLIEIIFIAFGTIPGLALAQTGPPGRQTFDVASIKSARAARAGGEGSSRENVVVTPKSVRLENASLSFCIQWAYNVRFYQVSGHGLLTLDRYDIDAKTDQPSNKERLRGMMQTLLADRFRLQLHRETSNRPVYELVAASKGVNLRKSPPDQDTSMSVVNGSFVFRSVTMPAFAEQLSDFSGIDRPVLDRTGIEGSFDITLASAAAAMREDPQSIFSAVERIGLRLEPRKGPVETLIVDHVERPSGN